MLSDYQRHAITLQTIELVKVNAPPNFIAFAARNLDRNLCADTYVIGFIHAAIFRAREYGLDDDGCADVLEVLNVWREHDFDVALQSLGGKLTPR